MRSDRPVKRARVFATAVELPGGRGMLTDEKGVDDGYYRTREDAY